MNIKREKWSNNFSEWFDWVISEGEFYDYGRYPLKGVGIWLPYGFKLRQAIIDIIRQLLNNTGHEEVLFPMLIPEGLLKKESEHIKGFEEEVYWVTKGGSEDLDVKLSLRPTSEAAITFMESLWIKSYKQLPKKYYQIVSIFRYETKATRPMIRLREVTTFKEAHTIHSTFEDAENQVKEAIEIYKKFFDILGIPYLISQRPEWDKFPGAVKTYAFDTIMPDGKTLQIGTVHHLGQHFTKAFDFKVQKADGTLDYPHQTSYGISDRVIASLISLHGDDRGSVLFPLVAPIQVIIIPIPSKNTDDTNKILEYSENVKSQLISAGIRANIDKDTEKTPGEKFYIWEIKGVPIRVEIGLREVQNSSVTLKRRDTLESKAVKLSELITEIRKLLEDIENNLKSKAWESFNKKIFYAKTVEDANKILEKGGVVELPWCGDNSCGLKIEELTNAKVKGIPLESKKINDSCVICKKPASNVLRIAKTY
uniref:Proline--tRNA ligase n=1 Tax=Acidianus brierleyi TaxID=41673 RepID=A0A2U9IFJ0_9CREN